MVVGVYVVEGQGIDSSKWCFTVYVNDQGHDMSFSKTCYEGSDCYFHYERSH